MTGAFNFKCKTAFDTLSEARSAGYHETGEKMLQIGYIRKGVDVEQSPVYIAGKGARAGRLFYLRHNPLSTRYCIRVYIGRWKRKT